MTIQIEKLENSVLATLNGSLDTEAATQAEQQLLSIEPINITLDCTGVDYIASSGLRLLLKLLKKERAAGKKVILRGLQPAVIEILQITNFDKMFLIE